MNFNNICITEASAEEKRICEMAFNQLAPISGWVNLCPWREVYLTRKERFFINGGIHQKDASDPLHLSVFYKPYLGEKIFFHIYGFLRSQFIITHITIQTGFKKYQTLCQFVEAQQ